MAPDAPPPNPDDLSARYQRPDGSYEEVPVERLSPDEDPAAPPPSGPPTLSEPAKRVYWGSFAAGAAVVAATGAAAWLYRRLRGQA